MKTNQISIVDFAGYLNGDLNAKLEVSMNLISSMKSCGFAYLKNFGIANDEVQDMFRLSQEFFLLPIETKETVKKTHNTFCGYDRIELERLSESRPADHKESFMVKQYGTPWLSQDTEFKNKMLSFHKKCLDLGFSIFGSILLGLDVDPSLFDNQFSKGECTILRLLCYPPMPEPAQLNQLWCGEHTDYGVCTILFQDSIGGLEIKTRDGDWMPAPKIENTVLINIGDCMEIWTRGYLVATPHRVIQPNEEEKKGLSRYSAAFFFEPDMDCEMKQFKKFQDLAFETKYLSKTYGEHLNSKYNATYSTYNNNKFNENEIII